MMISGAFEDDSDVDDDYDKADINIFANQGKKVRFFTATECTDDYISIIPNLFLRRISICSLYFYHFQGFTAMHLMPEWYPATASEAPLMS